MSVLAVAVGDRRTAMKHTQGPSANTHTHISEEGQLREKGPLREASRWYEIVKENKNPTDFVSRR